MGKKILAGLMRGLSTLCVCLVVVSMLGTSIIDTYRSNIDSALGTSSYVTTTDTESARFVSDYETIEDLAAAARDVAIREGEEGTVVMKNDNDVLPLAGGEVALFGLASYAPYPYNSGDLRAGNADAMDLMDALTAAGVSINQTVADMYRTIMNEHTVETTNQWTGAVETSIGYDHIYQTTVGDMEDFQISEIPADELDALSGSSDWRDSIDSANTTAICVFARAGGESNTYGPGTALNYAGEATGEDPLALSEDELSIVDLAKETCSKVIVLLNSGNTMGISEIAEGGAHEVDGIAYIGCINDYQCIGIANVLTGAVNATGALTDTYVVDNNSNPAVQNFGGDYYADYELVAANAENGYDDRYPNTDITNDTGASSFGGGEATYSGGQYIVEAEGIYVGYRYYETRYYDSIVNPSSNADSQVGATQGSSWDYDSEVIYPFGHSLSYLDYTQEVTNVDVDKSEDGDITATVAVTNNSDTDGKFLAQLYVQQPYTQYDIDNKVEKSAVMFLNSAKVDVAAGATEEVTITVPTKYLASYDYTNAKTYILDAGDYYFTAAAGAHEAINNILAAQGMTVTDGMDAEAKGSATIWDAITELDNTTFSVSNGTAITNVADEADLNYWTGEETVTYLSRNDWEATFPINYNTDVSVSIASSDRAEEWIQALRGRDYVIQTDNPATEAVDQGERFGVTDLSYDELADINNSYWDTLASEITIDEAVGAVIHGGSQSDTLTNIENPIVTQSEGVNGFTGTYTDDATGTTYRFNVGSQTLLGSSFNPELAHEWGLIEGNSGLWLGQYVVWGTGLTQRRTPYNGRNYEYISEDVMLTNRIGQALISGCSEKGIINGPKHIGFNDQEHNRNGVAAYMNEQKFREMDLRGFEGALEDGNGLAVMVAFNRIGPTNTSHFQGLLKTILRDEWGYTGIISTDMMNNAYYFVPESIIMSSVTMVADFAGNDNHINLGDGGVDATWSYISPASVSQDAELVDQARENLKYQLYTFANSAVMNVSTSRVNTWYDNLILVARWAGLALAIVFALIWLGATLKGKKKKGA